MSPEENTSEVESNVVNIHSDDDTATVAKTKMIAPAIFAGMAAGAAAVVGWVLTRKADVETPLTEDTEDDPES